MIKNTMLDQANIVQELKTHQEEFVHSLKSAFNANLMQTLQDFNDVGNEENTPPKLRRSKCDIPANTLRTPKSSTCPRPYATACTDVSNARSDYKSDSNDKKHDQNLHFHEK